MIPKTEIYFASRKTSSAHVHITKGVGKIRINNVPVEMINPETAIDYPTVETDASKKGVSFVSASGDPMPNHGEKVLLVQKPSGRLMSMRNTVCPCTGPLTSVAKLCDADHFVGFCSAGSFILNLRTNEVDWLTRKDDQFELELEIVPFAEAKKHLGEMKSGGPGHR